MLNDYAVYNLLHMLVFKRMPAGGEVLVILGMLVPVLGQKKIA